MSDKETGKKSSSLSKGFVWVILALLIVGLGGFGVSNFGGTVQSVASVGDEDISVDAYARALQEELRAMSQQTGQSVSLEQANQVSQMIYGAPATDRVLDRLITTAAFDNETDRIGLSVGDEAVLDQLRSVPAFQGPTGNFDRDTYEFALDRQGLSPAEFEERAREDSARTLVQGAVVGGVAPSPILTETLLAHIGEQRDFTWAALDAEMLAAPLPDPTEAELQAFYDANPDDFTTPKTKRISYAWLRPDALLDTIEVDEDALRGMYQDRIDEFVQPERRLVERLVFSDEDAATAAYERLETGDATFDELVEDRGLALSDVDLGDVTADELGDASDAVFALEEPGDVTAPAPSNLGPALYRMNGILNARETPFDEVREELKQEYALDRARRLVAERATEIDDMLASGATLEELASDTAMTKGQIDWHQGVEDDIAAYDGFRQAARNVSADDFPEIAELEDGSILALRLDEVVEPTLQPLDSVRGQVVSGWKAEETVDRLREQAESLAPDLAEDAPADELGLELQSESGMTRDGFIDGTPDGFMAEIFKMETGDTRVIVGAGTVFLVRLDNIAPPDAQSPDTADIKSQIDDQVAQGIAQDVFSAYARALRAGAGLSRNQAALNAVHAQFP